MPAPSGWTQSDQACGSPARGAAVRSASVGVGEAEGASDGLFGSLLEQRLEGVAVHDRGALVGHLGSFELYAVELERAAQDLAYVGVAAFVEVTLDRAQDSTDSPLSLLDLVQVQVESAGSAQPSEASRNGRRRHELMLSEGFRGGNRTRVLP